jgi:Ca2+-binding RTX toxin-like protein/GH24 family phage-related lysozyme (muramidase)
MLTYHTLSLTAYAQLLKELIQSAEQLDPTVADHRDTKATIGYGYTFNRHNNLAIWQAAGISLSPSDITTLQNIDAASAATQTSVALSQFTRSVTAAEADALFVALMSTAEYSEPADTLMMPLSKERAAFVSLTYNRGRGNVNKDAAIFRDAVLNGDRGEAWFQFRYMLWGSKTSAEAGLRARRLVEAQLFGLYDDPSNVSTFEAQEVYRMFNMHRGEILKIELQFGDPPDERVGARNMIAEVNQDPKWGSLVPVDTIKDALVPARNSFIDWINTTLPSGVAALVPGDWNPAAIYWGASSGYGSDPRISVSFDARSNNGHLENIERNLLVGGAGNDLLRGGRGNDVLVGLDGVDRLEGDEDSDVLIGGEGKDLLAGGKGFDTYAYRTGDGDDKIEDEDGSGKIVFDGINLNGTIQESAQNNVFKANGFTYTFVGGNLTTGGTLKITKDGVAGSIEILNFKQGHLQLTLNKNNHSGTVQNGTGDADNMVALADYAELFGLGGDDTLAAGNEGVAAHGNAGRDFIHNDIGSQTLYGDEGNDVLLASGGNDILYGGLDDDTVQGGLDDDYLSGDEGNDLVDGGAGRDVIHGGIGADILLGGGSLTANVVPGYLSNYTYGVAVVSGRPVPIGVSGDLVITGDDADALYGEAGNDTILAGYGADYVDGGDDDDAIVGHSDSDYLLGGAGNDFIWGDQSAADDFYFVDSNGTHSYAYPLPEIHGALRETVAPTHYLGAAARISYLATVPAWRGNITKRTILTVAMGMIF